MSLIVILLENLHVVSNSHNSLFSILPSINTAYSQSTAAIKCIMCLVVHRVSFSTADFCCFSFLVGRSDWLEFQQGIKFYFGRFRLTYDFRVILLVLVVPWHK